MAKAKNFPNRRYTKEQLEAAIFALVDRDLMPSHVCRLAREGELEGPTGGKLEPFELVYGTAGMWRSAEIKRRKGLTRTPLSEQRPQDAGQELTRRLIAGTENRITRLLDRQARDKERGIDWEEMRSAARAIREIMLIPEPKNATSSRAPSDKIDGRASSAPGQRVLKGALLAAMRAENGESPDESGLSGPSAS